MSLCVSLFPLSLFDKRTFIHFQNSVTNSKNQLYLCWQYILVNRLSITHHVPVCLSFSLVSVWQKDIQTFSKWNNNLKRLALYMLATHIDTSSITPVLYTSHDVPVFLSFPHVSVWQKDIQTFSKWNKNLKGLALYMLATHIDTSSITPVHCTSHHVPVFLSFFSPCLYLTKRHSDIFKIV